MERTIAWVRDAAAVAGLTWVEERHVLLDPSRCHESDPFLLWGWDRFRSPGGFPDHPHRGFETVTLVLEGAMRHRDSHGHSGTLAAGDVQWMTAGRGIIHSEMPDGDAPVRGVQLWIDLPAAAKMSPPRYQDLRAAAVATRREPGVELRVFSGSSDGVVASTINHVPITMVELRAEAGSRVVQDLPANYNAYLFVVEGSVTVGDTTVRTNQVAHLPPSGTREEKTLVTLCASTGSHALLIAGPPIGEPIVFGGPFVMNTAEEIEQAKTDLRAGQFAG